MKTDFKLIRLIKMTTKSTTIKIRTGAKETDSITTNKGMESATFSNCVTKHR